MWNSNVESERERGAKGADIALRLETFAVAVLELMPKLERHWASRPVARQLGRCATGGGSNYEEARGAESTADFVHTEADELIEILTASARTAKARGS